MDTFTQRQIAETLAFIDATIVNCEKVQPRLREGSPQLTLSRNRIKALSIAKDLLLNQAPHYPKGDLAAAAAQIDSIKRKSLTGIHNAKEGGAAYTRFSKIIGAADVMLAYLQNALNQ